MKPTRDYNMQNTDLKKAWDSITLEKLFEIEVKNLINNEIDYIIWTIDFRDGLVATASENLVQSRVSVELDQDFDIDSHIQELHDKCLQAIIEDPNYDLTEDY